MRKIVFLDMDGVINSTQGWIGRGYFRPVDRLKDSYRNLPEVWFMGDEQLSEAVNIDEHGWEFIHDVSQIEPHLFGIIRRLVEETEAQIVISSVWRMRRNVVAYFKKLFAEFGWDDAPIIGATPNSTSGRRGFEIDHWLVHNNFDFDNDRYVILDDDSDMLSCQLNNFVKCNAHIGIGVDQYSRAKDILDNGVSQAAQLDMFEQVYGQPQEFWNYGNA